MKISLDIAKLKTSLSPVLQVVKKTKKGFDPLYKQVQWDIKDKQLLFTTYDTTYGVEVKYGTIVPDIEEDRKFLIEAEALFNLVQYTTSETLVFDIQEDRVTIDDNGNPYEFCFYLTEGDLHQTFDLITGEPENKYTFDLNYMKSVYSFLKPSIARDVARTFLCGILYDGAYAATNSQVLGVIAGTLKDNTFFMLEDSLDYIFSIGADNNVVIHEYPNLILAFFENTRIVLPQVGKKFPPYRSIQTKLSNLPYSFKIDKNSIKRITQKLVPFADKHDRLVSNWTFNSTGSLTISVMSTKSKKGKETVTALGGINPMEDKIIKLNLQVIAELIDTFPIDTIIIKYSDNLKDPIMLTNNTESYIYYVSPLVVAGNN